MESRHYVLLMQLEIDLIGFRILELTSELNVIANQETHPDFIYRSDVLNHSILALESKRKELKKALRQH